MIGMNSLLCYTFAWPCITVWRLIIDRERKQWNLAVKQYKGTVIFAYSEVSRRIPMNSEHLQCIKGIWVDEFFVLLVTILSNNQTNTISDGFSPRNNVYKFLTITTNLKNCYSSHRTRLGHEEQRSGIKIKFLTT